MRVHVDALFTEGGPRQHICDFPPDLLAQGLQGLNIHMNIREGKGPGGKVAPHW